MKGAVVTGDAMFRQRDLCEAIVEKGGDFLFVAKDNQPALVEDIAAAFSPPLSPRRGGRAGKRAIASRNGRQASRASGTAGS